MFADYAYFRDRAPQIFIGENAFEGCEKRVYAEYPWSNSSDSGRVFCYIQGHRSWIQWTSDSTLIYSFAFRNDRFDRDLWTWWKNFSGPNV